MTSKEDRKFMRSSPHRKDDRGAVRRANHSGPTGAVSGGDGLGTDTASDEGRAPHATRTRSAVQVQDGFAARALELGELPEDRADATERRA